MDTGPLRLADLRKHGMHPSPREFTLPKLPDDDPKHHALLERHCREAMDEHHELLEVLTAFVILHGIDPRTLHLYQKETADGCCWYFSHPSLEAQVSDPAPTGGTGGHPVRGDAAPLPSPDGGGGGRADAAEAARHDS